jgi:hypothetical protein
VTLRQGESHADDHKQSVMEGDLKLEEVFRSLDCYEFLDACKTLKDAGIEYTGDEFYTGELRVGSQGRGPAPYLWKILVPVEQKENALALLSGRIAAVIGFADAGLKPLKPEQRKIFWIGMTVVALIWALIIWKLNF